MTPTPYSTPPTAPFEQPAQAAPSGRGRRIAVGAAIAGIGLITAVVLWVVAAQRYDDGIGALARAPVGCDTTLDFAESGEYLVFVETTGSLPEVRGDCGRGGDFDLGAAAVPIVDVRIVDPDGDDVTLLSRRGRESYDGAGSAGESLARIQIDTAGDHVVRVESSSTETFAVAIGRDPGSGVGALRLAALAVGLVALSVGLIVALTRGSVARTEQTPAIVPTPPDWPAWQAPPVAGPPTTTPPQGPPMTSPPTAPMAPPPAAGSAPFAMTPPTAPPPVAPAPQPSVTPAPAPDGADGSPAPSAWAPAESSAPELSDPGAGRAEADEDRPAPPS